VTLFNDSSGRPLNGRYRYALTLDLGDLPPLTDQWEIVLYDQSGYFCDNAINRYAIDAELLARGELQVANGQIVIPIQRDAPVGPDQARNWLPAPRAGFQIAIRLYGQITQADIRRVDRLQLVRNRSTSTWA
jgi:hypothetical protein